MAKKKKNGRLSGALGTTLGGLLVLFSAGVVVATVSSPPGKR